MLNPNSTSTALTKNDGHQSSARSRSGHDDAAWLAPTPSSSRRPLAERRRDQMTGQIEPKMQRSPVAVETSSDIADRRQIGRRATRSNTSLEAPIPLFTGEEFDDLMTGVGFAPPDTSLLSSSQSSSADTTSTPAKIELQLRSHPALDGVSEVPKHSTSSSNESSDTDDFGIILDEETGFCVEAVEDRELRGDEEYFLVKWSPSCVPSTSIQLDTEGITFVRINGKRHDVWSWKLSDDDASSCIVLWERSWQPKAELKRAADAIKVFLERSTPTPVATGSLKFLVFEPEAGKDYRLALRHCIEESEGPLSSFPETWAVDQDKRPLEFRPSCKRVDVSNPNVRRATFAYLTGIRQSTPCSCCAEEAGMFLHCVVNPDYFAGACTNCSHSSGATKKCDFHHSGKHVDTK